MSATSASPVRSVRANGLTLAVQCHGREDGEPLLLIHGLAMQLVAWHEDFVDLLVQRGFRVVRFDNRDIGLSDELTAAGRPNVALEMMRHAMHWPVRSAYTLDDMARDAVGVLDALGIDSAHVCGASMGGMIGQLLALDHPARVRSLTLMMTSSGDRFLPPPTAAAARALLTRPRDPRSIESIVDRQCHLFTTIGSPGFRVPPDQLRSEMRRFVERSWRPDGVLRQFLAVAAAPGRSLRLPRVTAPTLVIHGRDDPLVRIGCGEQLADRIPGARSDFIDGLGHDLPPQLWERFADGIAANAARHGAGPA